MREEKGRREWATVVCGGKAQDENMERAKIDTNKLTAYKGRDIKV